MYVNYSRFSYATYQSLAFTYLIAQSAFIAKGRRRPPLRARDDALSASHRNSMYGMVCTIVTSVVSCILTARDITRYLPKSAHSASILCQSTTKFGVKRL